MKIFGLYFVWRGGTIMQALSNAARGTYTIQWMFGLPEVTGVADLRRQYDTGHCQIQTCIADRKQFQTFYY